MEYNTDFFLGSLILLCVAVFVVNKIIRDYKNRKKELVIQTPIQEETPDQKRSYQPMRLIRGGQAA
ncbi:hypothetical protein KC842_02225 [Candidatus Nomurabacteria bacterium]|nr:hypothetical protein [Candidatus Nomurabacteria bacterium]USN94985.1 MAG: hypothetical protein H6791_00965 [Candidatus Nomurabacteria bacterium]